ncbi:MAG: gamma-glutamylcyclotransferase [Alphaproteobacteria bacterium]
MKQSNQKLYFAYGSNMCIFQMLNRCPNSQPLGTAILPDYKTTQRHYADIDYCEGSEVYGVLFSITEEDLKELDIYEGYPDLYTRKEVEIEHILGKQKAIVYEMTSKNKELNEFQPYSLHYRELCSNAADFWKLPQNEYKAEEINVIDLMNALYKDNFKQVKQMLFNGADVNAEYNKNNWTPFMWVCKEHPSVRIIEMFLNAGGDIHKRNREGQTPFMIAARKRSSPQTLDLLLKAGSDVNAKDFKGNTALDYVINHPQASMRTDVINFLEREINELQYSFRG